MVNETVNDEKLITLYLKEEFTQAAQRDGLESPVLQPLNEVLGRYGVHLERRGAFIENSMKAMSSEYENEISGKSGVSRLALRGLFEATRAFGRFVAWDLNREPRFTVRTPPEAASNVVGDLMKKPVAAMISLITIEP